VTVKPVDEEQQLTRALAQETLPLFSNLKALREHGPNAAELASLASRLALQGLDLDVSQPPAARPNPWKKWGWGGFGGVSAALVWLAVRGSQPLPLAAPRVATEPRTASTTVAERATATQRRTTPIGAPTALGEEPTDRVEAPAVTAATAGTTTSRGSPDPFVQVATGAAGSVSPNEEVSSPVSHQSKPKAADTRAGVPLSDSSGAPVPAGAVAPPSELALLRDARLVLRQSPARALELTDEHGRLYPQGRMTQERELIAVSALVALGHRAGALSRAASFERQYPTSPYRKQLGDLLR